MNNFRTRLEEKLRLPLPKISSFQKVVPRLRGGMRIPETAKKSAVLAIIEQEKEQNNILFIKRKSGQFSHASQVAFPGGKKEQSDKDLLETALRETREEIGVEIEESQIIGRLSKVYIPVSDFSVQPFVCVLKRLDGFKLSIDEVHSVLRADISSLKITHPQIEHKMGHTIKPGFLGYSVNKEFVWGATAMMLTELLDVIDSL